MPYRKYKGNKGRRATKGQAFAQINHFFFL